MEFAVSLGDLMTSTNGVRGKLGFGEVAFLMAIRNRNRNKNTKYTNQK